MSSDSILKTVILKATRDRVWRAISNPTEFGSWFGVAFDGPFVVGAETVGRIAPTKVDPEVAKLQEPHRGTPFVILIETIEPQRLFAFRWHPYAVDLSHDYADEPTTLVTFALAEDPEGIRLTITESGFDALPADRRDEAFSSNEGGWTYQTRLIALYVEGAA